MLKPIPTRGRSRIVVCLLHAVALGWLGCAPASHAQPYETSLNTSSYTQNFDSLGVSSLAELPEGWVFAQGVGLPVYGNPLDCKSPPHRFTTNAVPLNCRTCTRSYDGQNGGATPTGGGRVNWGDEVNYDPGWLNDRSVGFMSLNSTAVGSTTDFRSPTNYIIFGFTNNLGTNIIGLSISNNVKVYRLHSTAATVSFFYSYDGVNWVPVPAGGSGPYPTGTSGTYFFTTGPWVTNTSFALSDLNIPDNTPFYLCWQLVIANSSGSFAVGLGLDDVEINATTGAPPVILTSVWPGGSGNWSVPGNWLGSTLPVSSNRIVFAGAGGNVNQDLAALTTGTGFVRSLGFSNSASASYVLSGNAMTLLGSVTNDSVFNQTINNNLTLTDSTTFRAVSGVLTLGGGIANNGHALTFDTTPNSVINGTISGEGSLIKLGAGVLTLNGPGMHTGGTVISAGTLRWGDNERLPSTAPVTVTGTLDLNGFNQALPALVGSGAANLGSGTLTVGAGDGSGTFSGVISGSGGLTKIGAGTQSLTSSGNSYSGPTTASEGLLSISGTATLGDGTGTLNLAGGTLGLTGTRGTDGVLFNPIHLTADSIIQNSTTAAGGNRYLPFGGPVTATAGTLTIRNVATANTNVINVRFYGGGINFTRPIVFDNSLAGSPIYNTARIGLHNTNGTPDQVLSGIISGPGSIARGAPAGSEGGRAILSGANTFTFGVELGGGGELGLGSETVMAGSDIVSSPFGSGMLEWTGNGSLFAHGAARTLANYVFLNGMRYGGFTGSNALTLTGVMNIGTVAKGFHAENSAITIFAGVLTNSASLTKGGPGVLALTAANENTGGWAVTNGTLLVNNNTGSGTGTGDVTVTGDGILGGSGTIAGAVSGDGSIAPGESAGILTLGNGLDLSAGGALVWELAANSTTGPGVDFDVLALTGGNLVLGGASKLAIQFTGLATAPDVNNVFWQSPRAWTIVGLSGSAANPGMTEFAGILNGTYSAGSFTNYADVSGNIVLEFIPGAVVPEPVIDSTIAGAGTANATLSWSAVNGVMYQVQYKTNLNQPGWLIMDNVPASADNASFTDTTGPHAERYYRVIVP
jgi:autotransporter-associated beta strand protein